MIVVAFAALPTSSAAYVLAARMGGDGGYVAGLVTLSTLLGMFSISLWLEVLARLWRKARLGGHGVRAIPARVVQIHAGNVAAHARLC